MLNKRIINTGGDAACTTDTTQILNAGTTESLALYRFEDNAFDTSNSTGYINKGAIFNGSNSKISLTAGSFSYTGEFSITAWIKLSSSQTSQVILENYEYVSSTSRGFVFRVMTGEKLKFDGYYSDATRTDARSNESIPLGVWTHVAAVYNPTNSSIKLYINGSEVTYHTQTYNAMQYHSGCPVNIGCLSYTGGNNEQFFHGNIDELRVYGDALTATEVGYIANNTTASIPTSNLNALYSFEGNANDSTSYPINGTASNIVYDYDGSANNITYSTGKFGKAAVFNGSSTGIEIPNLSTMFGQKTSYTVSAWFKAPSSATGNRAIFDDYNYANSNLGLYLYDGVMNFFARYNNSNTSGIYSGTVTYNDNNWHHVVATSDQTTGKLYIDGQLISSGAMPSPSYSGGSPVVSIGKQQHPGSSTYSWFDGSIDQVRIFDHAISAAQVTALYNETATSAALATIDNPSTVAYYKMADGTDETGSYDATTVSNVDFNVQGKYGFAGDFNGGSSQIITGYAAQAGTTAATISLWINFSSYANSYAVIAGDNNSGATHQGFLMLATGAPGSYGSNGHLWVSLGDQNNGYDIDATTNFDSYGGIGSWIHVVVTVSGTSVSIYMNGSLVKSYTSSVSYAPTASAHNYRFGYISGWGYLDAKLDQIRFFNKAISAAEVTTLYNEIQCADTIATPESYFNTVLFTPTTSTSALPVTGVGFSPGLAWAKYRGTGSGYANQSHYWVDSVRGINSRIFSNSSQAESTTNYVQSFDSDGITYVNNLFNRTGANSVVGWFWKAGSSNVTNNDGSITSTVSASPESGFSIVKWVSDGGSSISTKGHGLNKSLSFAIVKSLDSSSIWMIFQKDLPQNKYIQFTSDGLSPDGGTTYFSTTSTTLGFRDGSNSSSGDNMIAYCFHDVAGYQRSGTYTGNGSSNGPFIYTGFEPAWILIKRTDTSGAWNIFDNKRNSTNPRNSILQANASDQEYTNTNYNTNFYTNGFQFLNSTADWNANGGNYIFLAIAANPDTSAPTKANSFNTLLYTGNDSNDRDITGLGFKPDFLWIKRRGSEPHALYDSVRGPNLQLTTHNTDAEATNSGSYLGMSSFDANGFNVGNNGGTNRAPHDYVAWAWKGLDHDRNLPAINNDGSITSLVSANIAAGFSIVSYRGVASHGSTVGHGLGGELDYLIVKSTNLTQAWNVYVKGVTDTDAKYFRLNESNGIYTTVNPRFVPGNFNDDVFSIGSDNACNGNNDDYIAYCFRSISGYSKVGTYTSTGATGSSNEITTGFQPRFLLVKASSHSEDWYLFDSERLNLSGGTNDGLLFANSSATENTGYDRITFSSTGFYWNTAYGGNSNGYTYFYLAIS